MSKVDLAFVVDSSGSISVENYEKEKNFIKTVAGAFGLAPSGSRAGVVVYSAYAQTEITLDQFVDQPSFDQAVSNIPYRGYTTRIDLGLQEASSTLLPHMRTNVPRLLVVITDGKQTRSVSHTPLKTAVRPFLDGNVHSFAIGIGASVDSSELRQLVKSPKDVFLA